MRPSVGIRSQKHGTNQTCESTISRYSRSDRCLPSTTCPSVAPLTRFRYTTPSEVKRTSFSSSSARPPTRRRSGGGGFRWALVVFPSEQILPAAGGGEPSQSSVIFDAGVVWSRFQSCNNTLYPACFFFTRAEPTQQTPAFTSRWSRRNWRPGTHHGPPN